MNQREPEQLGYEISTSVNQETRATSSALRSARRYTRAIDLKTYTASSLSHGVTSPLEMMLRRDGQKSIYQRDPED